MDASGTLPSGLLTLSSLVGMGKYDQCTNVRDGNHRTVASYAIATLHMPLPTDSAKVTRIDLSDTDAKGSWLEKLATDYVMFYSMQFDLGLCYPSRCSVNEIEKLIQHAAKSSSVPLRVDFKFRSLTETKHQSENAYKTLSVSIILSLLVIVMTSTILSFKYPDMTPRFALHFCAISNTNAIFKDTSDVQTKRLAFLNGIRFMYLLMSLAGHVYICVGVQSPQTHSGIMKQASSEDSWAIKNVAFRFGSMNVAANFVLRYVFLYIKIEKFWINPKSR